MGGQESRPHDPLLRSQGRAREGVQAEGHQVQLVNGGGRHHEQGCEEQGGQHGRRQGMPTPRCRLWMGSQGPPLLGAALRGHPPRQQLRALHTGRNERRRSRHQMAG
eukprot:4762885-Heterocapsa_arctica.AAC.1